MMPTSWDRVQFTQVCKEADGDLFSLVQKYHGSVSAEHGVGLVKKEFLHFSRTAEEVQLMRAVKKVFDPQGLLNPGKIFD